MSIETLTTASIVGDERLDVQAEILLAPVRTKVRVTFALEAQVHEGRLELEVQVKPRVVVVYGEQYNEKNMTDYLRGLVGEQQTGNWEVAVRKMRDKLVARGAKGSRK